MVERVFGSVPGRRNSSFKGLGAGRNLVNSKTEERLVGGEQRAGGRGGRGCTVKCPVGGEAASCVHTKAVRSP